MSVIISGMKFPVFTGEHKEFDRYGSFLTVYKNGKVELHIFDTDYTVENIPTPHGRLIDADDLLRQPMNTANYPKNYVHVAPTIIEAEE